MTAAAGDGSVWISSGGRALNRIDPQTLKVQKVIRVGSGNVAFDGRFIWSAASDSNTGDATVQLAKVDPETNRVVANYRIPHMLTPFMTSGFGALWLSRSRPAAVPL